MSAATPLPDSDTNATTGIAERTARLVGFELRRRRLARGWSRKEMRRRLAAATGHDVTHQTIATYETGRREMTVVRFAAMCHTLDVHPTDIWSTVDEQLHPAAAGVLVDLRMVAKIVRDDLAPARAWAHSQLDNGAATAATLTPPAIASLAAVCGLDVDDVTAALRATAAATDQPEVPSS
jgi:transcriptional regulator with XRE-family HTH domain